MRPPIFNTEFHADSEETGTSESLTNGLVSKWRPKERLKTTAVALVLCLNIGELSHTQDCEWIADIMIIQVWIHQI